VALAVPLMVAVVLPTEVAAVVVIHWAKSSTEAEGVKEPETTVPLV
jgi:hypothetical protein